VVKSVREGASLFAESIRTVVKLPEVSAARIDLPS
jgi:hypothetical protein